MDTILDSIGILWVRLGSLQLRILGWIESSVYGYGYLAWPGIRILHKYADTQPPIAPTPRPACVPAQHVSPAPSKATIIKASIVIEYKLRTPLPKLPAITEQPDRSCKAGPPVPAWHAMQTS